MEKCMILRRFELFSKKRHNFSWSFKELTYKLALGAISLTVDNGWLNWLGGGYLDVEMKGSRRVERDGRAGERKKKKAMQGIYVNHWRFQLQPYG